jgi:SAM-dependent methyltransferase
MTSTPCSAPTEPLSGMVVVFLGKKLITTDTVVPLMLALRQKAKSKTIRFYCFDQETFDAIKKNVVLWDAVALAGEIHCVADTRRGFGRAIRRLRMIGLLAQLAMLAFTRRVYFVHFRALNEWPFAVLAHINSSRTIFMEGNCWSHHDKVINHVDNIGRQRKAANRASIGLYVAGFSENWPVFSEPANVNKRKLVMPSSHLSSAWLQFITERADTYIGQSLGEMSLQSRRPLIVFILGYFGKLDFLASPDSMKTLFHETLDCLAEFSEDALIVLKPHAITDAVELQNAIQSWRGSEILVSYLHPAVLATRAAVFVANHYSTTFGDAVSFGVPTVEYTEYSPATLAVTGKDSMRPELVSHFIQRDPSQFKATIAAILAHREGGGSARAPESQDEGLRPALELLAS